MCYYISGFGYLFYPFVTSDPRQTWKYSICLLIIYLYICNMIKYNTKNKKQNSNSFAYLFLFFLLKTCFIFKCLFIILHPVLTLIFVQKPRKLLFSIKSSMFAWNSMILRQFPYFRENLNVLRHFTWFRAISNNRASMFCVNIVFYPLLNIIILLPLY